MASSYLLNTVFTGTGVSWAGALIPDELQANVQIAGGVLWPATDAVVAVAASRAQALRARGANEAECTEVMQAAASSSQLNKVRTYHANIVTASTFKAPGAKEPSVIEVGTSLLLQFTIGQDAAWRQFKIPSSYSANPSLHVHWTKSSNANELGKYSRWQVSYSCFDGRTMDANVAASTVESEQSYDDSGTTTRIVYRSANMTLSGIVAGWYLAIRIEPVAPTGTAMVSEPALFSADLMFDELINS
jgi:hypothetical protein